MFEARNKLILSVILSNLALIWLVVLAFLNFNFKIDGNGGLACLSSPLLYAL